MTKVLTLQSDFGPIDIEVDDATAAQATTEQIGGAIRKGATPLSTDGGGTDGKIAAKFDSAMTSLSNYAKTVQQMVSSLDVTPEKVTIDVGLKFDFKAGVGIFAIAQAGTTADMKVSLTWEPKKGRAG
ncbi:hypothetical protein SAMN05877809_10110 [Rhodobacter sp. JA431]|uniref:CU044_2847 family protein n=1 Tax=Rhodobacter sp. JA431 TaxID=570013 RepID=UPI000BD7C1F7|nr:CU044_2847 family protein [Rhodobacter sp. JA431]SOB89454.1 hypothetical protein SAMN05877809_10110 [Rhodobacter sp. JA431]